MAAQHPPDRFLCSVPEAAQIVGVSESQLRRYLAAGLLAPTLVTPWGAQLLARHHVEALAARRSAAGRPGSQRAWRRLPEAA